MCDLLEVPHGDFIRSCAVSLGEAMQLTNLLRDVGEDMRRGRIYIPMEDMEAFPGSEEAIFRQRISDSFVQLMKFEIKRARALYAEADSGIAMLPPEVRPAVKLARILSSRILDRIEARRYNVFVHRARTSPVEKLSNVVRMLTGSL
jgi:phytoene synthase